ncbi:hypothetical protein AgCh_006352 [Apium graveolens]
MANNRNLHPNQDPASVYFIHPSDASSSQLVSTKFNDTGYANWKRSMILSLSAKNKLSFVDGSLTRPSNTTPEGKAWDRWKAPNSGNAKRTYYCTHCQISGHSLERCFKVHGYPPGFKFKERKVAAISQNQLSDSSSNTTDPVISTEQYNQLIQLLNNHQKLCQDSSCEVLFTHDKCILEFPSQRQKVIPLGKIEAGLYSVDAQNHKVTLLDADKSHICNVACLSAIEDVKLWHLRLGHLPFQKMKLVLPSCNVQLCMKENICQVCPAAKQTRLSFPHSCIKTKNIFELVHLDIWGPYKTKTPSGCTMFLTIVDDYNRFTWVHLLKNKSDTAAVISKFTIYVENQFNTSIKTFRSDNAKEFIEGALKSFSESKGILQQSSCVYTLQQYGIPERKHRHLLETARALFFQSKSRLSKVCDKLSEVGTRRSVVLQFDLEYMPRTAIKGQALADFLLEFDSVVDDKALVVLQPPRNEESLEEFPHP